MGTDETVRPVNIQAGMIIRCLFSQISCSELQYDTRLRVCFVYLNTVTECEICEICEMDGAKVVVADFVLNGLTDVDLDKGVFELQREIQNRYLASLHAIDLT